MTKTYIDELVEEIARLRDYYDKAITREREMATKFNNAYWENQKLKELLKECRDCLVKIRDKETTESESAEDVKLIAEIVLEKIEDKIDEVLK